LFDTIGFAFETHCIDLGLGPLSAALPAGGGRAQARGTMNSVVKGRGPTSIQWVSGAKPTVSKSGWGLFLQDCGSSCRTRAFGLMSGGPRPPVLHVGRAPGPKSLFLGIRRCGRLFLVNVRFSLVFVAVGAFSQLVGASPWYSSVWVSILS
jgi:hypothetical protein